MGLGHIILFLNCLLYDIIWTIAFNLIILQANFFMLKYTRNKH